MIQPNYKISHRFTLMICVIFVFSLAIVLTGCSNTSTPAAQETQAQSNTDSLSGNGSDASDTGDDLIIQIADISETATFYPVEIDGTKLEVLAVKAPDGSIRTAFNTCEVCYDSGRGYYKQDGDVLVCQNCGNRFKTSQIEVQSNGCNPWPIFAENKTVDDESITISYEFLKDSVAIFQNWKGNY